jgi:hypothetical protein
MDELVIVNVLIPAIGTDVDVELPLSATPIDIINTLLEKEELNIPKDDPSSMNGESQAIEYKIFKREKNKRIEIDQDKPLEEQNILNEAKLEMVRIYVPG